MVAVCSLVGCGGPTDPPGMTTKSKSAEGLVPKLTLDNYQAQTTGGRVLIDFYADWCPPCRAMSPVVEELYLETKESAAKVVKCDTDAQRDLAKRYNIRSIPTFVVLEDGKEVARVSGVRDKEVLRRMLLGEEE